MTINSSPIGANFPQKLPQYTYIPGLTPHPISDVRGHAYGQPGPIATGRLDWGSELFNRGYYWEAHEAWEAEWMAVGRSGPRADLIKAFIKLAACGVKCLEGNQAGAIRHARRSAELFRVNQSDTALNGLSIQPDEVDAMKEFARNLMSNPPLATAAQQQSAATGGVPLLGSLPVRIQHDNSTA